jgi:2-keto-4-pentenoate hydratase/2-oxohepta-3-ene-1,7-dioic acid hydratase in catechol pathway
MATLSYTTENHIIMAAEYRLLTYLSSGRPQAGVLIGERVFPARDLLPAADGIDTSSVLGLLQSWSAVRDKLCAAVERVSSGEGLALAELTLEAPILYPGAVFATGGNYPDHLDEMANKYGRPPLTKHKAAEPFFTLKTSAHSAIGHGAPIRHPSFTSKLDYEAEIGVVIGQFVDNISEARAMDAVAGYTIINDLSARDYARRETLPNQMTHDWFGQKCFRDSMPMGPWLTPAEFVPDPYDMSIKLWVNGELRQNGSSKNMIYPLAEQISYLSRHLTLRPGDVISTGCPSGVGVAQDKFLKPGDEMRIEVSHCGVLANRVVDG